MQGLMLKLLNVDAAGERALRVVAYFDELLVHRPDLESVVRATAILADCAAGLRVPGSSTALRFTPEGDHPEDDGSTIGANLEIRADDGTDLRGLLWLERTGARGDLDEFILERAALVVSTVLERRRSARPADAPVGFADPALAALVVNERADEPDRLRAARLLGITLPSRVQALAISLTEDRATDVPSVRRAFGDLAGQPPFISQVTNDLLLGLVVTPTPLDWSEVPLAARAASGPCVDIADAPRSWRVARETLRFAGVGPSWARQLSHDQVSGLALLLSLEPSAVSADGDVRAVRRLSEGASGADSLDLLDRILHSDSLRSAARDSNYHHSSLQSWLTRAEAVLGFEIRSGIGRQRAAHALLLWQLFG